MVNGLAMIFLSLFTTMIEWFGFVEIRQNREKVKPTEVFAKVIRFD
jgi:hypothetical protein